MIISSLEKTTKAIIFNPLILLPMLIAVIVARVSTNLTSFVIERPLAEMLIYYETFMTSDFFFIVLNRYSFEIAIMLISMFIVLFIAVLGFIALVHFAKGEGIFDAINKSYSNFGKSLSLTFFALLVLFLSFISLAIIQLIFNFLYSILPESINGILAIVILPIILLVIFSIYLTKLGFILPAIDGNNIREAVKASWEFTNDKFINAFLYMIIVLIISAIIIIVLTTIGVLLDMSFIFELISDIIGMTFFGLSISYYYFNKWE